MFKIHSQICLNPMFFGGMVPSESWLSSRTGIPQLLAKNLLVEGHVSSHQYVPAKERMAKRKTCIFLGEICWSNFFSTMVFRGKLEGSTNFDLMFSAKCWTSQAKRSGAAQDHTDTPEVGPQWTENQRFCSSPEVFLKWLWRKIRYHQLSISKIPGFIIFPYFFINIWYFSHSKSSFPSSIILSLPDAGE